MMTERWHFTVAWAAWISWFLLFEAWAIFGPVKKATLSAHVRGWLAQQPIWVWLVVVGFMIWLTVHFAADLKRS